MTSVRTMRQWQWMIVSLLIGAGIGLLRERADSDLNARFGRAINGQQSFEKALLEMEQGRPRFADLRVHRQRVPDAKGGFTSVYVISGNYFDGHHEKQGGKLVAQYNPAFFLSDDRAPYKPIVSWDQFKRPDLRSRFDSIAHPTVIDYLNCLSEARGIGYSRDWWVGQGVVAWMAASFIVIGVIWPLCINLLVHGSLRRPPEEKGVDLSKVKVHTSAAVVKPPSTSDVARLDEVTGELERQLEGQADAKPPMATGARPPAVVKQLKTQPLEPAPVAAADAETEFGKKKDDYYPTALGLSDEPQKTAKARQAERSPAEKSPRQPKPKSLEE